VHVYLFVLSTEFVFPLTPHSFYLIQMNDLLFPNLSMHKNGT